MQVRFFFPLSSWDPKYIRVRDAALYHCVNYLLRCRECPFDTVSAAAARGATESVRGWSAWFRQGELECGNPPKTPYLVARTMTNPIISPRSAKTVECRCQVNVGDMPFLRFKGQPCCCGLCPGWICAESPCQKTLDVVSWLRFYYHVWYYLISLNSKCLCPWYTVPGRSSTTNS